MLEISMDPFLVGGLSWHGIFTALGVAFAVFGTARLARDRGMDPQVVYSCAAWAVPGGVVGARLVHVFDNWSYYINDPVKIFTIWNGGVGLWGALLGGTITGVTWAILNKQSVGKIADIAAPMMLVAQTIGRVGDVINGEHFSTRTSLPWGWVHTHANWPGLNTGRPAIPVSESGSELAYHPSVAYEMVGDVLLFFRHHAAHRPGEARRDGDADLSRDVCGYKVRGAVHAGRSGENRVFASGACNISANDGGGLGSRGVSAGAPAF